jgi:hypothetical protein
LAIEERLKYLSIELPKKGCSMWTCICLYSLVYKDKQLYNSILYKFYIIYERGKINEKRKWY